MTEKSMKTLHFNFTPVQSFVAQARRTQDLWAGSYLIAWLSGQTMNAVLKNGGKILMPDIDDDLLIKATQNPGQIDELAKRLGTLPNRFTANIPENQDHTVYSELLQAKWRKVANAVRDLVDSDKSRVDNDFWNRQIDHHWEITWVVGKPSNLLDCRKNLRLPRKIEESGEKCTVCGERQELSESDPKRQESSKSNPEKAHFQPNRTNSKEWWDNLRKNAGQSNLDLRDSVNLKQTNRTYPKHCLNSLVRYLRLLQSITVL